MTTSTKNTACFIVNFFDKTISGTKTSFSKASKGISPFYEELTTKMETHPTYTLAIKEPKHKSAKAKRTYEGMDFSFMENYIRIQENGDQTMKEYEEIKAFANEQKMSVYPFVKKWFLSKFGSNEEGFDMAKAKKEISDAQIVAACQKADSAAKGENA